MANNQLDVIYCIALHCNMTCGAVVGKLGTVNLFD